jgi:TonB family protein
MLPSDARFVANAAERWLFPREPSSRPEPGRFLALAGAVLVYALLSGLLLLESRFEPATPAAPTEIPVEIVAEPPPPPAPSPAPEIAEPPLDEKPAYDAPRPANDEKVERETPDTVSRAPPAPPTEKPPGEAAESEKAAPSEAKAEATAPAEETPAEPAEDKTVPEPSPTGDVKLQAPPPPQTRPAPEAPPQKPALSIGAPIPTFQPVPEVSFAGAAQAAPIAGGTAKARYLTIVYGMIMARVHRSPGPRPKSKGEGTVSFVVDGRGYLTERWTTRPSGSPELDAQIFEAVGQASPFPPPPNGRPAGLKFVYQQD